MDKVVAAPRLLRLRISAITGVIEQIVTGVCSLGVYALVLRALGPEDLGVWSLALTALAMAPYFSYPSNNTIIHFLSRCESENDRSRSITIVGTALMTIGSISVAVCLFGYWPFSIFMQHSVPATKLNLLSHLTPAVFASIFLANVAGVFLASLSALHRNYVRSAVESLGVIFMFATAWALFPSLGVGGAAIGLVCQHSFRVIAGAVALKLYLPELQLLRPRFCRQEARRMLALGASMQLMTVSSLFWEPFTRLLLGAAGSMTAISYFSVAWRIVWMPISLVNSMILALAPAFGAMADDSSDERERLQRKALDLVFAAVPVMMGAAVGVAPIASELLFGAFHPELVVYVAIIASGWYWQGLSLVFYLRSIGEGRTKWSVYGHLATSVVNLVIGTLFTWSLGAPGAVIGLSTALALGSMVMLFGNQISFGVRAAALLNWPNAVMTLASILAALACQIVYAWAREPAGAWGATAVMMLVGGALVLVPGAFHPFTELLTLRRADHRRQLDGM